jgi:hypothetical protein
VRLPTRALGIGIGNFGPAKPVRRRVAGTRFLLPVQHLPIETRLGPAGRFSFGVPWPWEDAGAAGMLVDATGGARGDTVLVSGRCPRTDGWDPSIVGWSEQGEIDFRHFSVEYGPHFANLYSGALVGVWYVLVGGARASSVGIETRTGRVDRLTIEWHDQLLQLEYRSPPGRAAAYLPHLETMLATWHWG